VEQVTVTIAAGSDRVLSMFGLGTRGNRGCAKPRTVDDDATASEGSGRSQGLNPLAPEHLWVTNFTFVHTA